VTTCYQGPAARSRTTDTGGVDVERALEFYSLQGASRYVREAEALLAKASY
jgi:hypothetical protein